MASESQMFVTGSKTFEITDYSKAKDVGNKNYIQSESFTVGGYDWVIQYYPQGINESVSDHVSIFVRVLNATENVRLIYSFRLWDWIDNKWSVNTLTSSNPETFLPLGEYGDTYGNRTYFNRKELATSNYFRDNTVKINCTLFVLTSPPTPAPVSKPDGNEENPKWSENSSKYGFHIAGYAPPNAPSDMYPKLPRQPTVRIYCESNEDLSMTARNNTVVLALTDPRDHYQHWIKDMSNGGTDLHGFPAFTLVNRVTGKALKNPDGEDEPVRLVPYNGHIKDLVFWTEESSTGFHAIRIKHNPSLNMTAVTKKPDGKLSDGSKIVVQKANSTLVQKWKIVSYNLDILQKLTCKL